MSAFGNPLKAHSLAVVGARFPNVDGSDRCEEIARCVPGEPIELRPEPGNAHDERAIAVFSARGAQIGYLPAERAPRIGALIRQGREVIAIFQGAGEHGAWIRLAFDGEEPVLPPTVRQEPAAVGADPEFEFEADLGWSEYEWGD